MSKTQLKTRLVLVVVGALITAALCLTTLNKATANPASSAASVPTSAAKASGVSSSSAPVLQGGEHPGLLRIFVHAEDIYPDVIRVKAGTIRLRAENETLGDAVLILQSVTPSALVAQVATVNQGKRAEQTVQLTKGDYIYYDQARPGIIGRLTVDE